MFTRTLDTPNPWCGLTFFPARRATSQTVEAPNPWRQTREIINPDIPFTQENIRMFSIVFEKLHLGNHFQQHPGSASVFSPFASLRVIINGRPICSEKYPDIYILMKEEGSQHKFEVEKNPRRARVRAETRTYGTDSPSRSKPRALSITPSHRPQNKTAR